MPLFADSAGTTVAFSGWGRGGVVLLGTSWALSNEGIAMGDNLALVLNALAWRDSRPPAVTFDEFHHGYGRRPGILSLIDVPARLGLAQLGLAFLLLLFALAVRFGQPVPLHEERRTRSEYLSSMSALLRKGHAVDLARAELGRQFLADAGRVLGLPPGAAPKAVLQAAAARRPNRADTLQRLIEAAAQPPEEGLDEARLLALARQWHQERKELAKRR